MNKHLKRTPHHPQGREDAWWYEEKRGIHVLIQTSFGTKQVLIDWRSIRAALARKDKKP